RWVIDNGIPLYKEDGSFAGYIGSCIDVTDRKQSEDALREREDLLNAVLGTAADSIITMDRRGIIVHANPATNLLFRYPEGELIGKNIKTLMPHPYEEEHDGYISTYWRTGERRIIGFSRETEGLRKDGSTFPVELAVSEIAHLGLFTGIHRDISVRKQ